MNYSGFIVGGPSIHRSALDLMAEMLMLEKDQEIKDSFAIDTTYQEIPMEEEKKNDSVD